MSDELSPRAIQLIGMMGHARPYLRRAGQHIDRMRERLALRSVA